MPDNLLEFLNKFAPQYNIILYYKNKKKRKIMNDNELLAGSSYWLTIILGSLYLRRWKIFWLEILILYIYIHIIIKVEDGLIPEILRNKMKEFIRNEEMYFISIFSIPFLLIILIFRINCIIAIRNARKLIINS